MIMNDIMDFWHNEWMVVTDTSEVTGAESIMPVYEVLSKQVGGCIYNLNGLLLGCDESYRDSVFLYSTAENIFLTRDQAHFFIGLEKKIQTLCNLTEKIGLSNEELNLRASLSTLKQAEAGQSNAPLDYNSWNHGYTFTADSYQDNPQAYASHPGYNTHSGSSAAGAYQFLKRFYTQPDFSPINQDKAAVLLMTKDGYNAAVSGNMDAFISANKSRWTSLLHWSADSLQSVFLRCRAKELQEQSDIATPIGKLIKQ